MTLGCPSILSVDPLPRVNDLVTLFDQDDREYRSRVEGVDDEVLTVARPLDLSADHQFDPGVELLVSWSTANGVAVLPVRPIAAHTDGLVAIWSLSPTRPGWIEQRRRYVRVPAGGPLALRLRGDGQAVDALSGTMVDLSEGALRCAVNSALADALETDLVQASFRFGDQQFDIPGRIVFRRSGTQPTQAVQLVVLFDEPVREADLLRRQIFAQQLRAAHRPDRRRAPRG
jgi:c-di-GMP-binding flagellar brake protein YcgR